MHLKLERSVALETELQFTYRTSRAHFFFCLMTQAKLGKITVRRLSTLKCDLASLLSNFSLII